MSGLTLAFIGFGAMLLLIAVRMPIGLSMLVVGALGFVHLSSWGAFFAYMKTNTYHQFANYTLSVIPLFILMGALAERSGLSQALFRAAEAFAGRLRGMDQGDVLLEAANGRMHRLPLRLITRGRLDVEF